MTNQTWPTVLAPRTVIPELQTYASNPARTITGKDQVTAPDAGFWSVVYDRIPFASRAQKLAWRALAAQLKGRIGTVDVPMWDTQVQLSEPITAVCGTGVSRGAVAMTINVEAGSAALAAGRGFSVAGATQNRFYRVKTVVSSTAGGSPGVTAYSVKVSPPLREAIVQGVTLEFNAPMLTCRLATDAEMNTGVDDFANRTLAKITFQEVLP